MMRGRKCPGEFVNVRESSGVFHILSPTTNCRMLSDVYKKMAVKQMLTTKDKIPGKYALGIVEVL